VQAMKEVLVVLSSDASSRALDGLRGRYPVKSLLPPRIAILGGESDIPALHALPEVEAILTTPTDPLPSSLSPTESTFIMAWQARQQSAEKDRQGEGLPWDAEGYLPPDPPKKP
jgi:hypothetical protein